MSTNNPIETLFVNLALNGLDAVAVSGTVVSRPGNGSLTVFGPSESAAKELKVRLMCSLSALPIRIDDYSVTVTLPYARGAHLDLPICLAVLESIGVVPASKMAMFGELSLEGKVRSVRGLLPLLIGAKRDGFRQAIVPRSNQHEAGLVEGIEVFVADDLASVMAHLRGEMVLDRAVPTTPKPADPVLSTTGLNPAVCNTLQSVVENMQSVLLVAPPGSGKMMYARYVASLMPPMNSSELLEQLSIQSASGLLQDTDIKGIRPFRAPHHTVSIAGLIGGGRPVRCGEVTLAHHGVLFLDEVMEFRTPCLDAIRCLAVSDGFLRYQSDNPVHLPANPLIIASATPCPCGYAGTEGNRCRCTEPQRTRYLDRMAQQLRDCFDLVVVIGCDFANPLRNVPQMTFV